MMLIVELTTYFVLFPLSLMYFPAFYEHIFFQLLVVVVFVL